MFIDVVPNGRSASAVLLRESYREGSKVRKRTLANLSKLPPSVVVARRVIVGLKATDRSTRFGFG
jgi:hypothetical protein